MCQGTGWNRMWGAGTQWRGLGSLIKYLTAWRSRLSEYIQSESILADTRQAEHEKQTHTHTPFS